jgi:hypothetical protein
MPAYAVNIGFVLLQETLSKIDILCHMIGKQLQKVVESLTEIRSACQVELSIPVGGEATENAG